MAKGKLGGLAAFLTKKKPGKGKPAGKGKKGMKGSMKGMKGC